MDIGETIKALKEGEKVTRKSWKNKDRWIMYVGISEIPYRGIGIIKTPPWIGAGFSGGEVVPWNPSHEDLLANDWIVVS